jgi:hypothetical protein
VPFDDVGNERQADADALHVHPGHHDPIALHLEPHLRLVQRRSAASREQPVAQIRLDELHDLLLPLGLLVCEPCPVAARRADDEHAEDRGRQEYHQAEERHDGVAAPQGPEQGAHGAWSIVGPGAVRVKLPSRMYET